MTTRNYERDARQSTGFGYTCKPCLKQQRAEQRKLRPKQAAAPTRFVEVDSPDGIAPQRDPGRPDLPAIEPLYRASFAHDGLPGREPPAGATFDHQRANAAVEWIETNLRHYQGRWAGEPLYMLEWQAYIIREIFGWVNAEGNRVITSAYVEAPRKSGKSTMASGVGCYLAYGDGEASPQVFFAAMDRDQAGVCYHNARHMVEASLPLLEQSRVYAGTKEIALTKNPGGIIKALSSDSGKQYGLNIHGLIFDELMTQTKRDLWDALTTAQGSREQPLTFAITTAGWDRTSICYELHELVRQIQEGAAEDDTFFGVVYGAEIDADWTSEEVWYKANPSLIKEGHKGGSVKIDYYRTKANKAKAIPNEQNAFRTLLLSQWVGQAKRFIDMEVWDANNQDPGPPNGRVAFGGLDLASTTDLAAYVVVARDPDTGRYTVHPHAYLPEDGIAEKERRDRVPYRAWSERGLIKLTPGATIDYAYIKHDILESAEQFDLRDISYDRWNATQIVGELEEEGLVMAKLGQGFGDLSAPTKELLRVVTDRKLAHGGHDVLRWCASNVATKTDPAGNVKPDKEKSAQRIDPIVALIMALDGWTRRGRETTKRSVYAARGLAVA
jgi:phage terminase large subunit-like protein